MEANLSFSDDIRLAVVIMKNEILKHMRGKRILVFGIIVALILVGITAALVLTKNNILDSPTLFCEQFLGLITLLVVIGATIFGATAIVSEFEERTALILFNRPIRKWSIFVGKFAAAFLTVSAIMVFYYVFVIVACMILTGGIPGDIWISLILCLFYVFGTVGIAMMFSSLMKKSATASILTFFAIILLFDTVASIVAAVAEIGDTWFMLNTAASSIADVITDAGAQVLRDIAVMFVWGLVPAILGFVKFRDRDF